MSAYLLRPRPYERYLATTKLSLSGDTVKNRNLKINKELTKGDETFKLTRRVSQSIRDRLAKQAAYVAGLMESHWVGKGMCNQCQGEIEPFSLTRDDISMIKTLLPNVLTQLSPEDMETATSEFNQQTAADEIAQYLLKADQATLDHLKARRVQVTILDKPELTAITA